MRQIVLAGVAAACLVSAAQAAEKKSLYFVVNGASDFWKAAEAGVKKAQSELPNYTMQLKYPEQSSAAIQNRLMDDLVAAGPGGRKVSARRPPTPWGGGGGGPPGAPPAKVSVQKLSIASKMAASRSKP